MHMAFACVSIASMLRFRNQTPFWPLNRSGSPDDHAGSNVQLGSWLQVTSADALGSGSQSANRSS